MKKFYTLLLLLVCSAAMALEINKQVVIVCDKDADIISKKAVETLSENLGKLFNSKIAVVTDEKRVPSGVPVIVCSRKVVNRNFAKDEHYIAVSNGKLLISGGKVGIQYAVYEFLEKMCGLRYLGVNDLYIPKKSSVTVPDNCLNSGVPHFQYRFFTSYRRTPSFASYLAWHRVQDMDKADKMPPELGGGLAGSPRFCHTFWFYGNAFPEKKPEYFSMVNGKRLVTNDAHSRGQLCLSNMEMRREFKKQLRRYIAADREKADKNGGIYPEIYSVQQNDNNAYCQCKECNAMVKRLGSQSDLMIDFVNDVANDIAKDFPEIKILTFAYNYVRTPPKTVKPAKNVIIQIALTGGEFSGSIRDVMRPLSHPLNRRARDLYESWYKTGANIATWEYGLKYHQRCTTPYLIARGLQSDMKYFASRRVQLTFMEFGNLTGSNTFYFSFYDLKCYIFFKLMQNPNLNMEELVDDYMKHAYGPAAKPMKEYFNYLEKCMDLEKSNSGSVAFPSYMTYEFFYKCHQLLTSAEKLAAKNKKALSRIAKERIPHDFAMLALESRLYSKNNKPFTTKKQIIPRIKRGINSVLRQYSREDSRKQRNKRIRINNAILDFFNAEAGSSKKLPPEFAGKKIVADLDWIDFVSRLVVTKKGNHFEIDPDAHLGKAACIMANPRFPGFHTKPYPIGVYDNEKKKIVARKEWKISELPKDEKYHWFTLENVIFPEHCQFFTHWTWTLCPVRNFDRYITPGKKYDIHLSIKFQGKAYVPNSTRVDAVFIDRIILIEK